MIPNRVLTIAVGSKNPVKLAAASEGVRRALECVYPNSSFESEGFDVASGVPDQPFGDAETKRGALNRCLAAFESYKVSHGGSEPSFSVGLEGGCVWTESSEAPLPIHQTLECFAWMVVYDGKQCGFARTCSFTLPAAISDLVKQGMELGDADDKVFKMLNSKQKGGTVGNLTKGVIDRTDYYIPAIILACVPFVTPELYPPSITTEGGDRT